MSSLPSTPYQLVDGGIILNSFGSQIARFIQFSFRDITEKYSPDEYQIPSYISPKFMHSIEYDISFPHLAVYTKTQNKTKEYQLSPAVCDHIFQLLSNKFLPKLPYITLVSGRCFRNEESISSTRLKNFTMSECVVLGENTQVKSIRAELMKSIFNFSKELGLNTKTVQAQDPFFLPLAKNKYTLQKVTPLKYELVCEEDNFEQCALASFNFHTDFFTQRCRITANCETVSSGCVAIGIERWVVALVTKYGSELKNYPQQIQDYINTHET